MRNALNIFMNNFVNRDNILHDFTFICILFLAIYTRGKSSTYIFTLGIPCLMYYIITTANFQCFAVRKFLLN